MTGARSLPDSLTMPIPPRPGAVAMATIGSRSEFIGAGSIDSADGSAYSLRQTARSCADRPRDLGADRSLHRRQPAVRIHGARPELPRPRALCHRRRIRGVSARRRRRAVARAWTRVEVDCIAMALAAAGGAGAAPTQLT